MSYYAVAEITIRDPGWVRDYVAAVTPMVERHGGRFLARTGRVERVEGKRRVPHTYLIIRWPSRDAALAFYHSDDYRPHLRRRIDGADSEFVLVAGEDATGTAHIEP